MQVASGLATGRPGRFVPLKAELPGNLIAAVDLDGKGRLDLVGLDRDGRPIRLVNSGKKDYRWQVIRPVAKIGPISATIGSIHTASAARWRFAAARSF